MKYKLSLAERQRYARNKRERYHRDPAYRLARINERRTRAGMPAYASLDDVQLRPRIS